MGHITQYVQHTHHTYHTHRTHRTHLDRIITVGITISLLPVLGELHKVAKSKKTKKDKEMLEQGSRQRAGKLLSGYLRSIAQEVTETVDINVGNDQVERRLISKAEAIARDMLHKALKCDDEKIKLEYRKLIMDRIEGRAGADEKEGVKSGTSIPDKVSEINKKRINAIADAVTKQE